MLYGKEIRYDELERLGRIMLVKMAERLTYPHSISVKTSRTQNKIERSMISLLSKGHEDITALLNRMTHRKPGKDKSDSSEEISCSYSSHRRRDSFRMHISQLQ